MLTKYDLATRLRAAISCARWVWSSVQPREETVMTMKSDFFFFSTSSLCLLLLSLKLPSCLQFLRDDISSAVTICHHLLWQMKRQWKTKNNMITFPIKHLTFQTKLHTQFLWTLFLFSLNKIIPITMMNCNLDYNYCFLWQFWKGVDIWYRDRSE